MKETKKSLYYASFSSFHRRETDKIDIPNKSHYKNDTAYVKAMQNYFNLINKSQL